LPSGTPLPEAPLTSDAAKQLRHELRTPVNHIVGYAEMLLEDAADPQFADRRAALEETIAAARDVLTLIHATLPSTRTEIPVSDVVSLYTSLQGPQERIVSAVGRLMPAPGSSADPEFEADLGRILQAAERLVPAAEDDPQPVAETGTSGDAGQIAAGDTARLLVVDDDPDNREVLRRRLEREGYRAECAEDGERALEMVAREPFDLVLLDVMMPGKDGYEVLEELKRSTKTRDIPVIMISALDDMRSVVRCIEGGAEDYLPKPFDPVLLRARISASLEKKRFRDQEVDYLRQVDRVVEAAAAVEAGEYRAGSLAGVAGRADSLGRLARVFDGMAEQVRAREDRLRDRIRDLRLEIDAARQEPPDEQQGGDDVKLSAGERLAERYEIAEVIGYGAMGTVYRARDLDLDEDVAIKTLRSEFISNPESVERFKTEIRLARRISHPNVVRTHDFGESSGLYYLTMEYVEGLTLHDLIEKRGRLGVSAVLAIGTQLADSLVIAHEQGVVHRDIKPANLLLDSEGALKVMDFGVARLAEGTTTLTQAGSIVGTPAYMSPEQLLGEDVDARCDLYSVGVVLYECLTGRLPLDARSTVSLIAKVLNVEPRPVMEVNDNVPEPLSELIVRLLVKEPESRVQSAVQLSEELSRLS
jgi:DNA-binding response OmpR family regulator/tRNA A-37 threonylcarbamoyl transferase component Bud32